jgi:hypothetical protein
MITGSFLCSKTGVPGTDCGCCRYIEGAIRCVDCGQCGGQRFIGNGRLFCMNCVMATIRTWTGQ